MSRNQEVEDFSCTTPKTKDLLIQLKSLEVSNVLIVTEEVNENLYLASRNLKNVDVSDVAAVNPVNLISHDKVLITVAALKQFEEALA